MWSSQNQTAGLLGVAAKPCTLPLRDASQTSASYLQSKSCRAVVYFILFYFVLMHVYTTLNKGLSAVEGFGVGWNENSA